MRLFILLLSRSFRSRPLRTVLSLLGIVFGVAAMVSINAANTSAMNALTNLFENTSGKVDLIILPSGGTGNVLPEQLLNSVSRMAGVRHAAPVIKETSALAADAVSNEIGLSFAGFDAGGLAVHGIDPDLEKLVRVYQLVEGQFVTPGRADNQWMFVDTYAEENDLSVGDSVDIMTPNGTESITIAGLFAKEGAGLVNNGAFAVANLETMQQLFDRGGELDQIDLIVDEQYESAQALEDFRALLQDRLGSRYSVVYPASQGQKTVQMLSNYQIGLNFLSGIALFVGVYLIYNAFNMTVIERTRELGMLRTIGMSRKQIIWQMVSEALILGVAGSAAGIGLGLLMADGISKLMARLLNMSVDQMVIPLGTVVTSFLIGVVVTVVAALVPALQAGKISPMAAVRIRGQSKPSWMMVHGWKPGLMILFTAAILLLWNPFRNDPRFILGSMTVLLLFLGLTLSIPASIPFWDRLMRKGLQWVYGSPGSLGSRNIDRSRLRTTITIGALLVGISMVIVVRGMTESFIADLEVWLQAYLGGDIYVNAAVPLRATVGNQLMGVEGVQAAAAIRYFPVEWVQPDGTTESITFMAVEPAMYTRVTGFVFSQKSTDPVAATARLASGQTIFISSVLAEKYNLAEGNIIHLRTRKGYQPFTIGAVVVDFYENGQIITGAWSDMRQFFHINDANTFLIQSEQGSDIKNVADRIEKTYGKRYQLAIEVNKSLRDRAFSLLDQAFFMFDVLAVISILVASLGVVNTLTMSVIERRREIAMLRAIGFTRRQVLQMILSEAAVMGVAGGVMGLVVGVILTRLFLLGMTAMSGYKLEFILPLQGIITTMVIALVIAQAAALLPAMRAVRTNLLESIRFE
ncbi:MAG: FtsX-like permease family protein [Anaerolineae bacterium]|nr:FtsX-like permease family protein [Anaerolineae bacterium]